MIRLSPSAVQRVVLLFLTLSRTQPRDCQPHSGIGRQDKQVGQCFSSNGTSPKQASPGANPRWCDWPPMTMTRSGGDLSFVGIVPITRVCHDAPATRPRSSTLWGSMEVVIAHARVDLTIVDSVFIIDNSLWWISRWGVILAIVTFHPCITPVIGFSISAASGNSAHSPPIHEHYYGCLATTLSYPRNRFRSFVLGTQAILRLDWSGHTASSWTPSPYPHDHHSSVKRYNRYS
jgi:hypothetical protein